MSFSNVFTQATNGSEKLRLPMYTNEHKCQYSMDEYHTHYDNLSYSDISETPSPINYSSPDGHGGPNSYFPATTAPQHPTFTGTVGAGHMAVTMYSRTDYYGNPTNTSYPGECSSVEPITISIQHVSNADKPFACEWANCEHRFKRQEHLKRHELKHTGEKSFVCEVETCAQPFSRKDNLKAHMKTHQSNSPRRRNQFVPGLKID